MSEQQEEGWRLASAAEAEITRLNLEPWGVIRCLCGLPGAHETGHAFGGSGTTACQGCGKRYRVVVVSTRLEALDGDVEADTEG